jgi:hypothetical protein
MRSIGPGVREVRKGARVRRSGAVPGFRTLDAALPAAEALRGRRAELVVNRVARRANNRALGRKGHGRRRPAVGRVGEAADLTARAVLRGGARQRRAGAPALRHALRRHRVGQATLLGWRASAVEATGDSAVDPRRRRCGHPAVGLFRASAASGDQDEHAGMPRPPRPRPSHARSLSAAAAIGSVSHESPLASNGHTGIQTTGTTDNPTDCTIAYPNRNGFRCCDLVKAPVRRRQIPKVSRHCVVGQSVVAAKPERERDEPARRRRRAVTITGDFGRAGAYTDFHMFKIRSGEVHGIHAILASATSSGWE